MSASLSEISSDVAYGFRQMRRNISFSLICVAVLAIGIGSATAVFAVLYNAVLRPLPYRDANQLVYVHNEFPGSQLAITAESGPDFRDLTTHHEIFSETAAYYFNDFTMTGAGIAQHVDAVNASASLFPMLGMAPELGREFNPEEDRYGAANVVVLSDAFWRIGFGANRGVIGRSINLDGTPFRIIGVMPHDFNFPYPATQMWIPLALSPSRLSENDRGDKWLQMIARVAPGFTPQRANVALADISPIFAKANPDDYPLKTGWHFTCAPMAEQQTRGIRGWLLLSFGAVLCVLLIACTNVSGLLLIRAGTRQREWALRAALGASPARLVRQILTETALLVFIGCGAGIFLSLALVRLINEFGPIHRTSIEPWTYLFALGLCVVATAVAGVFPATILWRMPLEQALKSAGSRTSSARGGWKQVLVAGQIGVAIALLFTATALSRSFIKLMDVSPGFSPNHVWTASIQLPERQSTPPQFFVHFFEGLAARISALPGVQSVTAVSALPFSSGGFTADLYFPGRPETAPRPSAFYYIALPGYIETMEIPLLEGRTFTAADGPNSPPVAIVDRAFVQKYFSHEDPIGKLVANNGHGNFAGSRDHPATIIGVVGSVANRDLAQQLLPAIYVPAPQMPRTAMYLIARMKDNTDITAAARNTLRSMDSSVALFDVATMPARILDSVKLRRFVAWLLNCFAFIGVLLAALGLYGTLAHLVELRRREIAIRMALGANIRDIQGLVAARSMAITLGGLLPGILLSLFAAQAMRSFFFGVTPLDPWIVGGTITGFFLLALLASWNPVRKASRVDALATLREE